jgi:hypothetical protein
MGPCRAARARAEHQGRGRKRDRPAAIETKSHAMKDPKTQALRDELDSTASEQRSATGEVLE